MYRPPLRRGQMIAAAIVIALLLACVWALWVGEAPKPRHRWLPELHSGSHKLTQLRIEAPSGQLLVDARRGDQGWRDEASNAALDHAAIGAFVIALAKAELVAAETSLAQNYAQYNQLPAGSQQSAWRVRLASDGGYLKVLHVGAGPDGHVYGRVEPDPTVFRIRALLPWPPQQPLAWHQP